MSRRWCLFLFAGFLLCSVAWASTAITVDNTAGGVAIASATSTAEVALITVETASIRYEYDGTAPTATTGHLVQAGGTFVMNGTDNIRRFRAIRTTSTSAVLTVTLR